MKVGSDVYNTQIINSICLYLNLLEIECVRFYLYVQWNAKIRTSKIWKALKSGQQKLSSEIQTQPIWTLSMNGMSGSLCCSVRMLDNCMRSGVGFINPFTLYAKLSRSVPNF